jgi:hypothetical protein
MFLLVALTPENQLPVKACVFAVCLFVGWLAGLNNEFSGMPLILYTIIICNTTYISANDLYKGFHIINKLE